MYNYLQPQDDGLPMRQAGAWAREKLDYLARDIAVLEVSMRNKWERRNYVDLLAGPGKNRVRDTGEILLGSPLLALTAPYPFTGYYFVEYNEVNAEALRRRCGAWPDQTCIHIQRGDCNVLVDDIVAEIKRDERSLGLAKRPKGSLNLAFLDPQGMELHWATVAKLASVRRMDLIINYPQYGLSRNMRQAFASRAETAVDRFFGDRGWRAIYDEWRHTRRFRIHRRLVDWYKSRLAALGYQDVRGGDEFADEPVMRNVRRQAPLYWLLFASKHPLGARFWHEVTRRDVYGQRRLFER